MATSQPIQYIELGVGGMTCDDCVRTVTGALESVAGVKHADVDLETRRAVVEADPAVSSESLTAAVRSSGYNAFPRHSRPGA